MTATWNHAPALGESMTAEQVASAKLARIVMENSEEGGEICGMKFRVSKVLSPGLMLIAYPDRPHDGVWVKTA